MSGTVAGWEHCLNFINCQLAPADKLEPVHFTAEKKLAVTLSRQTGSGALAVAQKLAEYLQARAPGSPRPWTVFDRNLVGKALEEQKLPGKLARYLPEDRVSEIDNIMQELLGLHPPTWTLVHQVTDAILKLAECGNVILVGRGANVITAKLSRTFHVRLVGSLEKRIQRIMKAEGMDHAAAAAFVDEGDRGRRRYLHTHFRADIDNPLLYHMIINTDLVTVDEAARIIGAAVLSRQQS